MLKFSIIINNYNYASFLADAIESALQQTYSNLEVIIVDDGSTDASKEIIERYQIKYDYIKTIQKGNGGQASAFNAGFQASCGDLILFLDSDDRLLPDACSIVAAAWQPTYSRLSFDLNIINSTGVFLGETYSQLFSGGAMISGDLRASVAVYELCCIPTSGNVFPRNVLNQVFPLAESEWRICADTPLLALSAFFGPACSLPFALGEYRLHDNNGWFQVNQISPKIYLKQMELREKAQRCLLDYEQIIKQRVIFPKGNVPYWQAKLAYSIFEEKKKGLIDCVRQGVFSAWNAPSAGLERCMLCLWFPWIALMPSWFAKKLLRIDLPIYIPQIDRKRVDETKKVFIDRNRVVIPE